MAEDHVQILVDVVIPEGRERWEFLFWLIENLTSHTYSLGVSESVWVVPSAHGEVRGD